MNFGSKKIVDLSNDELRDAIFSVGDIDNYRFDKLGAKRKRHEKLFKTYPPVENPTFIQLINELNEQFKLRQLGNL